MNDSPDADNRHDFTHPYASPPASEPYDMSRANRAAKLSLLGFGGFAVAMVGMLWLLLFL